MKKHLLYLGLLSGLSFSSIAQQTYPRPEVVATTEINDIGIDNNSNQSTGTMNEDHITRSATCIDKVTYTTDNHNGNTYNFIQIGGTEGWQSGFQVFPTFTGQVTQVEFRAKSAGSGNYPVTITLHNLNSNGQPAGNSLSYVDVTVTQTDQNYIATFSSPIAVSNGFAIGLFNRIGVATDSAYIYMNGEGSGKNKGYSYLYHDQVGTKNLLSTFSSDIDFLVSPTIKFNHQDPTLTTSGSTTFCSGNQLNFVMDGNNTLPHYTSPVYNPQGISYSINFGDGSAPVTQQTASHTYNTGGSFSATGTTTYIGWTNNCVSSPAPVINLTVNPRPAAFFGYQATGRSVAFTGLTANATSQSWDFGDGGTSSAMNPLHNYTANGTYSVKLTVTGTCGTDFYSKNITVSQGQNSNDLSVDENELIQHLNIYPNPAQDDITLTYDLGKYSTVNTALITVDGKIIHTDQRNSVMNGETKFDLSKLSSGVYFISVKVDNNDPIVKQVIKQ